MKLYLNILCLLLLSAPLISAPSAALQKTILAIKQTEPDDVNRKVLIKMLENIIDNKEPRDLERSLAIIEQSLKDFDFLLRKVVISAICVQLKRDQRTISKEFKLRHADLAEENVGKLINDYTKPAKSRAQQAASKEFAEKTTAQLLEYAHQQRAKYTEKQVLTPAESELDSSSTETKFQEINVSKAHQKPENLHLDIAADWAAQQDLNMQDALQNLKRATAKNLAEELSTITAELNLVSGYTAMLVKSAICGKVKALFGFNLQSHKYAQAFIKEHGQSLSFDQILTHLESQKPRRSESKTTSALDESTAMPAEKDSESISCADDDSFYTTYTQEFKPARGY